MEELSQKTRLSREEIIQLFKSGKKKQDIQKMRGTQHQPLSKKPKLSQGHQQKILQIKSFLRTMKNPLDNQTISILLSEGLNEERILKFARDFNNFKLTEQDIQFLIKAGPAVQTKDDFIRLVLALGVKPTKQLM